MLPSCRLDSLHCILLPLLSLPQLGRLHPQTISQVFCHSDTTQERTLVSPVNWPSSGISSHKQKLLPLAVKHWPCFRNGFQRKVPCVPSQGGFSPKPRAAGTKHMGKGYSLLARGSWAPRIQPVLAWKSVLLPHSAVLARPGL